MAVPNGILTIERVLDNNQAQRLYVFSLANSIALGTIACVITSPSAGASLPAGTPVTITGMIDVPGTVVVKLGSTTLGAATMAGLNWSYSWTPSGGDVGAHTINATATASSGGATANATGVGVTVTSSVFGGDFSALFASFGLTVVHDVASHLGRSLTGSIINSITAQTGPTITEAGLPGAGLASTTTGLGGKAGAANGSGQWGTYTLDLAAPATTPFHEWYVCRMLAAPSAPSVISGANDTGATGHCLFVNSGTTNLYMSAGGLAGPVTMATNVWGCLEASLDGTADSYIKFGAGAAVAGDAGNANSPATRAIGALVSGGAPIQMEWLRKILVTGTRANFQTAVAAAKTAAQSYYSGAVT